ncbi:hypothetical protein VNO77_31761 [Canavalia gladiata]|uniref:Uncharacterized protein n=1 Tax=Canavalia gladiata TaxID=3824 RepID=A0AAN9KRZ0_CANGL
MLVLKHFQSNQTRRWSRLTHLLCLPKELYSFKIRKKMVIVPNLQTRVGSSPDKTHQFCSSPLPPSPSLSRAQPPPPPFAFS